MLTKQNKQIFLRSSISDFSDDKFLGYSIDKARKYEKIQRNLEFDSSRKKRNRGKKSGKIYSMEEQNIGCKRNRYEKKYHS